MDVESVLCMKGGDGKNSYSQNSSLQRVVMLKVKPILEESLTEVYTSKFPECLVMADLGCSSGPNTLVLVREVIDIIRQNCQKLKTKPPIFHAFLNDLPANDFNSIFNLLPSFYEKLERENDNEVDQCFVSATVGSFYRRLFPPNSLHFVHSSSCLHWRSKVTNFYQWRRKFIRLFLKIHDLIFLVFDQVPEGLVTENGIALNKGNICVGKNSNQKVVELYLDLFKKDFSSFLRSRSAEMVKGGTMVLTFLGRQIETIPLPENQCLNIFELLARCFQDMVLEGEIEEAELDSFNIPFYDPTETEVKEVIEEEGSFSMRRLQTLKLNWDQMGSSSCNQLSTGEYMSKIIRAVYEPLIAYHFGHQILDSLFQRLVQKVEEYEKVERGEVTNIVVSLIKS